MWKHFATTSQITTYLGYKDMKSTDQIVTYLLWENLNQSEQKVLAQNAEEFSKQAMSERGNQCILSHCNSLEFISSRQISQT